MKIALQNSQALCVFLISFSLLSLAQYGMAQEVQTSDTTQAQFGGPASVQGQEAEDRKAKESLIGVGKMQGYLNWKDRLREKHALSYTLDYTSAIFAATNTLNADNTFASGAVRFFGSWSPVGRKSGNKGSFIWKIENRHKYTNIGRPLSRLYPLLALYRVFLHHRHYRF